MPSFHANPYSSNNNRQDKKGRRRASLLTVFLRSAHYEGGHLLYHRWDFLLLLWLPLLTILGVWWTFSNSHIVDLPIGVIDNSHSSYSRTLTRYLDTSPDLTVYKTYQNTEQVQKDILETNIYGVVIIPNDFAEQLNRGNPSPVVLKVNAQYGTHSGIIQRGVQTVVGTMSAGAEITRNVKKGKSTELAKTAYSPIGIERISLFNLSTDYQQFLASTVIPALMHILAMIIGVTVVGRELRDRTLSVWYNTITHPTLPYPDFDALKRIPPEERLAFIYQHRPSQYLMNQPSDNIQTTLPKPDDIINAQYHYVITKSNHTHMQLPYLNGFNAPVHNLADNAQPYTPKNISILALIVGLNGKLIWGLLFYMLWGALMILLATNTHPASIQAMLVVWIAFIALTMISFWMGAIFSLLTLSLRIGLSSAAFISAPSYAFAGVTFPLVAMSSGAQRWANALPLTHYLKIHIPQLQMMAPLGIVLPTLFGLIAAVLVTLVLASLLSLRALKNPQRWGAR